LIFHKKESAKLRDVHHKFKKQVDQIKEAEKQDEQALKFNQQRNGGMKPTTAGTNKRGSTMVKNGLKHIPDSVGMRRPNTTANDI
jgi:hypothetical protein